MRATEILRNEHRVIEQVLDCLQALVQQADATGALDAPAARATVHFFRHFADGCHHAKEELHLFRLMEERGFEPQFGPTGVMRSEHEQGRVLLGGMESSIDGAAAGDAGALASFARHAHVYLRLLREHIRKEDHCLFPLAERSLSDHDQAALLGHFESVEHEDVGDGIHEQFLELADRLARKFGVDAIPAAQTCGACACGHPRQ